MTPLRGPRITIGRPMELERSPLQFTRSARPSRALLRDSWSVTTGLWCENVTVGLVAGRSTENSSSEDDRVAEPVQHAASNGRTGPRRYQLPLHFDDLHPIVDDDPNRIVVALHLRSVLRRERNAEQPRLMPDFGWQAGYSVAAADHVLERLGTPWNGEAAGASEPELWAAQLRDGLDVFARICWCLRFGHTPAAVALARRFIERWTYNLAFATAATREKNEEEHTFIQRVWSVYAGRIDAQAIANDWARLSDLLHGREILVASSTFPPLGYPLSDELRRSLHDFIVRSCEAALFQINASVGLAAAERGVMIPETHLILLTRPSDFLFGGFPPETDPETFLSVFHEPLTLCFVRSDGAETALEWGAAYREIVRSRAVGPLELTSFHAWMSLEERWVRNIEVAREAFDAEERLMGEQFDSGNLRTRLIWYQTIAEMADLVAYELPDPQHSASLHFAAASLESAWILWLQDVDDSLACMRSVLECVARARTYRLKPNLAAKLASRAQTTPHRWLDAAGWGRLSSFARSLGEFAHIQERSRHFGSRELLTAIQEHASVETAPLTGRAKALERIAMMLAHETASTLDSVGPVLASAFRASVLGETEDESEATLSDWLQHAFLFKSHDFGPADFGRPGHRAQK